MTLNITHRPIPAEHDELVVLNTQGGVGMSAIHVEVTAEHIASAARVPDVGEGWTSSASDHKDPVELALQEATGQPVTCDSDDGPEPGVYDEMATIGTGQTVLVVNLGADVARFIDRYYRGEPIEPFSFDLELEDWLVALIAKAATTEEQGDAVLRADGLS